MRNLISGIIGLAWGGFILVACVLRGGPQGEGAYYAGQICALVMGVLFFVGGVVYFILGLRELRPDVPRKKRRRVVGRVRKRRRSRWDEDD